MWLFGYGSLIWRPDLEYEDSKVGYIKGHVRRFWQYSTDHRGTEEAPGRVVTLIPYEEFSTRFTDHDQHSSDQDDITWGVAYKIPESKVAETKAYLDHREKNGYETQYLDVFQPDSDTPVVKKAIVYIGATNNSEFAGPAPLDQIALQIYSSHGPSGANKDYLLNLAHSLRTVAPTGNDQHIYELEAKVKELMLRDAGSQEAFDFMISSIILQSKPPAVSPV